MPTLPACHQLFGLPLVVLAAAITVPVHSQPIPVRYPPRLRARLPGPENNRGGSHRYREDHLDLPSDVSNGLPPNLLLDFRSSTPETKLSFVAPTAKPRLISVSLKPAGEVPFSIGGTWRKAIDYVLHVELGGLTGVIAPMIGKQPPDYHIWILEGAAPAFIREEVSSTREDPSGASNKSAPHSAIEFIARNPQGVEQPHMPPRASS
jgi:hypothetical protein